MDELTKKYLSDDKELYKKYKIAEEKYYQKLGDKYDTIQMEFDLDETTAKKLFIALASAGICFDDLMLCLLKEEIIKIEMDKL